MMNMNGKILCLMLIIGVIFSVSSVCAADLNDTQIIPEDDFIQHDINYPDINCTDNSTDNSTEIDNFDNIPKWDIDLNNTGVLPQVISYDMEPVMIENTHHNGTDYLIIFNFVKSSDVKNLTLHFDVDGNKHLDDKIDDSINQITWTYIVISSNEKSENYLPDFNEITITVSYILNDKIEFSKVTFEKSDFES